MSKQTTTKRNNPMSYHRDKPRSVPLSLALVGGDTEEEINVEKRNAQGLWNMGFEYALSSGHDNKTAIGFAAFYAIQNLDAPSMDAGMPLSRALRFEYPRHLEETSLKNLHPSRLGIGVSI
jgi:hypothetical protein